jgi:tyrosyl-tRNA synthetase
VPSGMTAERKPQGFTLRYRDRGAPEDVPAHKLPRGANKKWAALLAETGLAPSRAEAERLIKQGGVEIDGARVDDVRFELILSAGGSWLLRAGKKKFLRIVVE